MAEMNHPSLSAVETLLNEMKAGNIDNVSIQYSCPDGRFVTHFWYRGIGGGNTLIGLVTRVQAKLSEMVNNQSQHAHAQHEQQEKDQQRPTVQ